MDETSGRDAIRRLTAALGGRRRLVAAALLAVAVMAALRVVTPAPARTVLVWAAARDLTGGRPLDPADLTRVALPIAAVPAGALRAGAQVAGRLLAAPMRRGEPLTDVRLLEPSLLAALPEPGLVAVPIRVADGSAAAALVHPGDRIDVLAVADPTAGGPSRPTTVATAVRVLAVPGRDNAAGDGGGLVVVAVTSGQAAALAQASAVTRLSLALDRPDAGS
ncbi:MAG: pilus assembly protein CpaB [Frankiaceae bacterium]|nr:pilus assembly protein CpaB [Frankiaceae bacterium]